MQCKTTHRDEPGVSARHDTPRCKNNILTNSSYSTTGFDIVYPATSPIKVLDITVTSIEVSKRTEKRKLLLYQLDDEGEEIYVAKPIPIVN